MSTQTDPTTQSTQEELVLTRFFDAPRALVFEAWTNSKHLAQWWGPHGFTNPRCEWDLRPGGLIHVDMRAPDGTIYPMGGMYREIVEPERLVFTTTALDVEGKPIFEILNTILFAESGTGTMLTTRTRVLNQTGEATQYLDGQAEGWSQMLERFADFAQSLRGGDTSAREIVLSREFDASPEMLWDAKTDPEKVVRWWGPREFTTTIEVMDVRPGGTWTHVMHGPDGTDYPNASVFTVVEKPRRLSFRHTGAKEGGTEAVFDGTWTFDATEKGGTKVTVRMVFLTAEVRNKVVEEYGAIEGGKQTLERLDEEAAAWPIVIERTFNAPAETVWKAITERERMKEWRFELEEFVPEVGFEFEFVVEHEGMRHDHLCKVVEVIPDKKLAYTWRYADEQGDSVVSFELFPDGAKTTVRLTHEGVNSFPKTPAYARKNFILGWTMIIGANLKKYVETGD